MLSLKFHDLSISCDVAFVHVLSSSSLCSLCPPALVKAARRMKLERLDAVARWGVRVCSLVHILLLSDSYAVGQARRLVWSSCAVTSAEEYH